MGKKTINVPKFWLTLFSCGFELILILSNLMGKNNLVYVVSLCIKIFGKKKATLNEASWELIEHTHHFFHVLT